VYCGLIFFSTSGNDETLVLASEQTFSINQSHMCDTIRVAHSGHDGNAD
jgi:hypothetical protein